MSRNPLEMRALLALYRNHPSTSPEMRWGWRARREATQQKEMLLEWASTKSDEELLWCRNLGKASLAWIRASAAQSRHSFDYDADERWLIENDGLGASQIVAKDVVDGERLARLLNAAVSGEAAR